jgi:hypothetical protein
VPRFVLYNNHGQTHGFVTEVWLLIYDSSRSKLSEQDQALSLGRIKRERQLLSIASAIHKGPSTDAV